MLEVIIALGLVPVLILSLFFLFGRSFELQRQADDLTRAGEVGRQFLEELRMLNLAQIPSSATFDGRVPQAASGGFPPAPYPCAQLDGRDYYLVVATRLADGARAVRVAIYWDATHSLVLENRYAP